MFESGIYIIRNVVNGRVYVGSAENFTARWNKHLRELKSGKHFNSKLQRAWNKYGSECFTFEPIVYCPKDQLFFHEQLAIHAFSAVTSGYNIAKVAGSSMAGREHSTKAKQAISKAGKGVKKSPESVAKRAKALQGRSLSLAQRKQIAATLSGRPASTGTAKNLKKFAELRTPEYTRWLAMKGAANRWGKEFNTPKPNKCFLDS